jgi:hypothetical protein
MSLKSKFRSIFQCFCLLLLFLVKNSTGQVIQQMTSILPPDTSTCIVPNGFPPLNAVYPPSITIPADSITQSGYSISNIPIDSSSADGTSVSLADDAFGGPYPIGFTFNYYGVDYANFYISANGYIGFTSPLPNTFNFNGNNMTNIATLCADTSNLPNNAIFGYYQDFNPSGVPNAIRYQTTGVAPNRVLTVYFSNLPFFSSCLERSSFRIKIFETTRVIQIHLNNKPICASMWQGSGYSGLASQCPTNNIDACISSYTSAGTDQAFSNVAFQYTPFIAGNTEPITASLSNVTWQGVQGANNTPFTISSNTSVTPIFIVNASQSPRKYIIKITYDLPCALDIVYIDTFVIRYIPPPTSLFSATETGVSTSTSICLSDSATITYTGNASPPLSAYTYLWDFDGGMASLATSGPGPFNISWSTPGVKNITLRFVAGTCTSAVTTKQIIVNTISTSSFTVPTNVCVGEDVLVDYTGNGSETATYLWDFDGGNATQLGPNNNASYNVNWSTAGIKNITLSVGCTSEVSSNNITVNNTPSVSFSPVNTLFCNNSGSVELIGGIPLGGLYSGAGVIDGSFNPAIADSGSHSITYTYTDENDCSNFSSAVFEVIGCTSLEMVAQPLLEIHPNPMEISTLVSLKNYVGPDSQFNLLLMDATGRKVFEKSISADVIRGGYLLNIPELASGTYLLMLNNSNYMPVKRLVK